MRSISQAILTRMQALKRQDFWYARKISNVVNLSERAKVERRIRRTVRLIGNFPGLWQRTIEQTPGGLCQAGNTLFVADGSADHYVILNALQEDFNDQKYLCNRERVWVLHMEPEDYIFRLGYDGGREHELASRVYTNSETLISRGGIYRASAPYVHFHIGRSWDYLSAVRCPKKSVSLGIITSDLSTLDGHLRRLKFLEKLEQSGIEFALWGRGEGLKRFRSYQGPIRTKWQAHSVCKYSLVLENTLATYYWSEKIADSLLAYSLPLYYGSRDVGTVLPGQSFIHVDIDSKNVVEKIRAAIQGDEYSKRQNAVISARRILLNEQNLYSFLDRELNQHEVSKRQSDS